MAQACSMQHSPRAGAQVSTIFANSSSEASTGRKSSFTSLPPLPPPGWRPASRRSSTRLRPGRSAGANSAHTRSRNLQNEGRSLGRRTLHGSICLRVDSICGHIERVLRLRWGSLFTADFVRFANLAVETSLAPIFYVEPLLLCKCAQISHTRLFTQLLERDPHLSRGFVFTRLAQNGTMGSTGPQGFSSFLRLP